MSLCIRESCEPTVRIPIQPWAGKPFRPLQQATQIKIRLKRVKTAHGKSGMHTSDCVNELK